MNIKELEDLLEEPKEVLAPLFPARAMNITPEEYRARQNKQDLRAYLTGQLNFSEFARRVYRDL